MTKKLLGVFTTIVAALAVVGVAWASGDDGTSTCVTAATASSAGVSADMSTPSTEVTVPNSSPSARVNASTSTDASTSTNVDDDSSSTTSTSIASTSSTSAAGTTSTSIDDHDDTSTTSTTIADNDRVVVPDGITTHNIPGVGIVTIEAFAGELFLTSVSAAGWNVEHERIEKDRIELEFTNELDAEAEFEARIKDGRIEVRIEVHSD